MKTTAKAKKLIEGKPLIVGSGISEKYAQSVVKVLNAMHKEALKGVEEIYEKYGHAYASDSAIGQDGLPKGGSLISQLRIFFNALLNKYNPIFNLIAKKSTEKMVEQTLKNTKSTLNLSLRELGQGLAIKMDYTSERVKDITQAATMEAVSLIKTIPQKHLGDVQKVLMHSISSDGKGYAELKPFLQKLYKGNARKAHLVAIDQTRKTYLNIQAENMKYLGIKKFKWVHSGGGREPRKLHQELNGKVFSFDDPPYIGDMYGQKVYGLPGHLPNCFIGSTNFFLPNGCKKLFRRRFDGKLTKLITASGKVLMVTPNHPILTNNGWCAADKVNVGDYVFKAVNQIFNGSETNIDNMGVCASDLFNSISQLLGSGCSTASSPAFEFHGDISDNEVDIIDIDSFLSAEFDARLCKELVEFLFTWTDKIGDEVSFLEFSPEYKLIGRAFFASNSIVSRFNSLLALFSGQSSIHSDIRSRLISDINVILNENTTNNRTTNTEFSRDCKHALSLFIQVDNFSAGHILACVARAFDFWDTEANASKFLREVVGVTAEFSGYFFETDSIRKEIDCVVQKISGIDSLSHYVYNLETSKNWYLAEDIISHNCGCSMSPVFDFEG